jgi:hypothetical protein
MRRFKKHTKTVGDCVVWTAYSNPGGYGQFKAGKREDGRNIIIMFWISGRSDVMGRLSLRSPLDLG